MCRTTSTQFDYLGYSILLLWGLAPMQTLLKKPLQVFRITWKLQAGEFDQVWNRSLQDNGPPGAESKDPLYQCPTCNAHSP